MPNPVKQKAANDRCLGASIAEFGASLMIIIPVLLLFISLASLTTGYVTLNYACQIAARDCGASPSGAPDKIQSIMNNVTNSVLKGPLGTFGCVNEPALTASVEWAANGSATYVARTYGSKTAIDANANIYRYHVIGKCKLRPLFWPKSLDMQADAIAFVENPRGLDN